MKSPLIAAAFATLLSVPAAADAFKVGDLGAMPSRRACVETAAKVLETYVAEHGASPPVATRLIHKAGRSMAGACAPA